MSDVNNLGKFEAASRREGREGKDGANRRENRRPRPNRILGRDLVGSYVLRIIRGLVRALSRHVVQKYEEISTPKNLKKNRRLLKLIEYFIFMKKKIVNVSVLLKLSNIEILKLI